MITILSVNWNSYDFAKLLLESIERFTSEPYEVILVDNSSSPERISGKNLRVLPQSTNIGHGAGLNVGIQAANGDHVMCVDADCHFLSHHWVDRLLSIDADVITGRGVPAKPIRPACLFIQTKVARRYDWNSTPGYLGERKTPASLGNYDVAITAYHRMMEDGVNICLLDSRTSRYGTVNGEEWLVGNQPFLYHHWSGTWLHERQKDFPNIDLNEDKRKLFQSIPWRIP